MFAQITQVLAAHAIGLASVIQREPGKLGSAEVVLLTYAAPESALAAAEGELARLSCMRRVEARIRVESGETSDGSVRMGYLAGRHNSRHIGTAEAAVQH